MAVTETLQEETEVSNIDPITERPSWWIFTFGCGHYHKDDIVLIKGSFNSAREEMMRLFGAHWCGQYPQEELLKLICKYNYNVLTTIDISKFYTH